MSRPDSAGAVAWVRRAEIPGWPLPQAVEYRDPHRLFEGAVRQWFEVHVRQPSRRWPLGLPSAAVRLAWPAIAADVTYVARSSVASSARHSVHWSSAKGHRPLIGMTERCSARQATTTGHPRHTAAKDALIWLP